MSAYKVIFADGTIELERQIGIAIKQGMMPVGGIAVSDDREFHRFYQAVCDPVALLPSVQNLVKRYQRKKKK